MIYYDLGPGVEAKSTNIGDLPDRDVITPAFQAHSSRVAIIPDDVDRTYGVDALITDKAGVAVGVRTADCVPILLYDPVTGAIGAVHSGWKGTVANIIGATVGRMREVYGCAPSDMRGLIGPCIHVEAFEVGDEVYEAFADAGYADCCVRMTIPWVDSSAERWHVDLPEVCARQLREAGVGVIEKRQECTYLNHERLYSYRRSRLTSAADRIITSIRRL